MELLGHHGSFLKKGVLSAEVRDTWRKGSMSPVFKKGRAEEHRNTKQSV